MTIALIACLVIITILAATLGYVLGEAEGKKEMLKMLPAPQIDKYPFIKN